MQWLGLGMFPLLVEVRRQGFVGRGRVAFSPGFSSRMASALRYRGSASAYRPSR